MREKPGWRRYLRFFGPDVAADVDDELRFHLESKVDELVEQGWPRAAARDEARRQFGNLRAVRQTCETVAQEREKRRKNWERLSACYQDLQYGARQLRQSAGTSLLALITLGLGMGAVIAVFSIVYAVLLRPLPFTMPERLVSVWSTREGIDDVVTPRNFDAWKRESHSFDRLGALQPATFTLAQAGQAAQIAGGFASADFFQVFGMSAQLGRTFTAREDRPPRLHVAILSHRLWQERFGGDPEILGRQIRLNREPYTVIGVMPAQFSLRPGAEQVWAPLALSGQEMNWTGGVLHVVGRLRPTATREQAQAEMNLLGRHLEAQYPEMNRGRGIRVRDYAADLVGDYRSRLLLLLGAVGFVLLIACSNVANLLLARGAGRTQELAVRAALGASRLRIVRQLLTESFLVAIAGAVLGLAFASGLVTLARGMGAPNIPRLEEAGVNGIAFLFALGLALLSTFLSGLLPALRAAQVDIQTVLRRGGRGAAGLSRNSSRDSARSAYIAAEVALALVLLVCAALLIRTAMAAERIRPGFSADRLLTGRTALPANTYRSAEQVSRTYERILEALRNEPGVLSAALSSKVPLTASTVGLALKPGAVVPPLKQEVATELRYVSAGYLAVMQIPLLQGREFTNHDRAGAAHAVVVSHALARRLWPKGNAIGQTLRLPELESGTWEVVGVAADVRDNGVLSEPPAALYVPFAQVPTNPWRWIEQSLYLVARTRRGAVGDSDFLRRPLGAVDTELPLGDVQTMEQRLAGSVAVARFYTLLLSLLGFCGLLLTMAGIYGVVSYFVSRQRAEIGVRLALGATQRGVLLLVIRQGMRPVVAGVVFGLLISLAAARLMATQLYGVSWTDPLTLFSMPVMLLGVAALACYLPARQAAHVEPMAALRSE